jgi:septal ring factor EnvC (AmiA/AmiB activator)
MQGENGKHEERGRLKMNFEEFMKPAEPVDQPEETEEEIAAPDELDVQRTVVEALAAEKAEQEEQLDSLRDKISKLENTISELRSALANVGEVLSKNSEKPVSNQVSLLDRNVELDDRFPGETRDHVLEVLRAARDADEKEGRLRRAQLLEAVLVANEPLGELAKRRAEIEKLFADNGNIVNGSVIAGLEKMGIAHKDGDTYLLASEIIKRNY